jgi:hypothetical protein
MSDLPNDRKMCFKRTFSFLFFFHLIKPIKTFYVVIQKDSSDWSLELVEPRMGKSPCEQFIIFYM